MTKGPLESRIFAINEDVSSVIGVTPGIGKCSVRSRRLFEMVNLEANRVRFPRRWEKPHKSDLFLGQIQKQMSENFMGFEGGVGRRGFSWRSSRH